MSSRAVLHVEEMYFSDCKNETKKIRDEIWWLEFELIEVSFLLFITFDIYVIYQFQICFSLNSLTLSELSEK
jgi:NADH:ubiquinone oxidoreductase subunit 3 (subunit A)